GGVAWGVRPRRARAASRAPSDYLLVDSVPPGLAASVSKSHVAEARQSSLRRDDSGLGAVAAVADMPSAARAFGLLASDGVAHHCAVTGARNSPSVVDSAVGNMRPIPERYWEI